MSVSDNKKGDGVLLNFLSKSESEQHIYHNLRSTFPTHEYMIYTIPNCPYCKLAKDLLNSKGITCVVFDIQGDNPILDKETLKNNLKEMTGKPVITFPIIFTMELGYIGGYDDLEHHLHKKEMKTL